MKILVVICLGILVVVSAAAPAYPNRAAEELSPFTLARRIGAFHLFSTSVGKYTIRHDGWGEVYIRDRKRNFRVNTGARQRIKRLYFLEYEGDLLLLYEAGASGYLLRLDQKTRKVRRATTVTEDFEPPLIKDHAVTFSDGTVVPLN